MIQYLVELLPLFDVTRGQDLIDDGIAHVLLAFEIVVKSAFGDPQLLDYLVGPGSLESLAVYGFEILFQNALARVLCHMAKVYLRVGMDN